MPLPTHPSRQRRPKLVFIERTFPMPRLTALFLSSAALILGLAACGGSSSSSTASSATAAPTTAATSSSAPASTASSSTASSSTAAAGGAGSAQSLAADPSGQLKFTKTTLTAKAGKVTINFTNMAPEKHNLTLQSGTNGPTIAATPTFTGGSKTLVANLKPGTYTFYCSVPGHRMAGMQGTLTVS
jgi:plastocyanin